VRKDERGKKNPEPVEVRDWKDKIQSQAVAGFNNARVAAA
jgi:hypothetical protein